MDFANLAPGRYRFEVRAVTADGASSVVPAAVGFTVLLHSGDAVVPGPRLGALAAGAWAAFRYRVRHLLEIEGVRTRIAADLHDDIGSSLTRIAILSEVARRKVGEGETGTLLGEIAETTRSPRRLDERRGLVDRPEAGRPPARRRAHADVRDRRPRREGHRLDVRRPGRARGAGSPPRSGASCSSSSRRPSRTSPAIPARGPPR